MIHDVVVIGLGGVGSFCLRSLSKRGVKALGLERFHRCHDRGSSHGGSRIYRKAYFEHPSYVPWIQYSENVFTQLDPTLLERCGTLIIEEAGGSTIERCSISAQQHDIETEFLSNIELRHRYPQFKLNSNETVGLMEPGGGFVRPERVMEAALNDAEKNGAEIMEQVVVDHLEEIGDYVEIHMSRDNISEVIKAKAVIVASGSWASQLIPSWASYLTATRQLQAWIDVGDDDSYLPSNLPTWCMVTPMNPLMLYGIPKDPTSDNPNWVKYGLHLRDDPIDPSFSSRHLTSFEENELLDAAKTSLICDPVIALAKPCLYTMSPDGHFIVGRVSNRVVAAAGLSGHGFKMTPALGEMLVDLTLDEQNYGKWEADFLSPKRFQV